MSHKLLKIVIPTYNRPALIANLLRALGSVVLDPRVEVVVVDDCSSEKSKLALRDLEGLYSSVRFLFLEKNTGGAGARNAGASEGNVKWIWFIDDDDMVSGDAVLSVLEEIENISDVNRMVFLSANFIGKGFSRIVVPSGVNVFKRFARYGNEVNTSCTVFRYDLFKDVGGWDGRLVTGQDADLLLRSAELSDAHVLSNLHVDIIQHDEERITTNPRKQMKGKVQFLFKHYRRLHPIRSLRYAVTFLIAYPYIRMVIGR